ncbi:MAG TPA: hypothetical protein ENL42_00885 [Thermoplasmatales archaeon]|nr:hypothetical protein [Thermoplasmatales archaeon]
MKYIAALIPFLLVFSYFGISADEKDISFSLNAGEIKIIDFPFGTEIHMGQRGDIEIEKYAGLYNGERKIFLVIHSNEGGKIWIRYELSEKPLFTKDEYDLLIIAPSEWKDELQPLKEHKEQHGIKTIIVSLDEIYGGKYFAAEGRDDAEKIKYFIKNAIEEWGIEYVMLVGGRKPGLKEDWWVPVRYVWLNDRSSSWEYERKYISDLYYADIYDGEGKFSTWDSNNNGYFGEYDHEINGKKLKDSVDLLPDVYIGRLAARNVFELRRVMKNIINYENSHSDAFNNVVLCGGDLYLHDPWDIAEGEYLLDEIAERMKGYNIKKIYASVALNAKLVNEVINEGAGIVVFEGAGNHHLWATHAKDNEKWIFYYERNILQLRNSYLPIVLTSGARLGQFNWSRECFNWFFVSRGKAVASVGPTGLCRIGHGKNVTEMFLGNLHVRLCEKMASRCLLGRAWGEAITEYLLAFRWHGVAKAFHMKAAEELEIFGDPTLKIGGYDFAASVAEKTGRVLHVGGSGEGNYTSIQDAVNAARDGDAIIVHKGTYYENLSIDKSLIITGKNAKIKTCGITFLASDIVLRNFSIEGYGKENGIVCYGSDAIIEGNKIERFNTSIFIFADNCFIANNTIKNNECGIWINGSRRAIIEKNNIVDNWYGVWGEKCHDISIEENNFLYNAWYAIWMEGKGGKISRNNISRNWYCIYLYNSEDFVIDGNYISWNIHGPQFVNSSHNVIEGNTIARNEHYGIYFGWRSVDNEIAGNNFIENAQNARDDAANKWWGNYWSDYIGLRFPFLFLLHIPKYIPKFSFDWQPLMSPA